MSETESTTETVAAAPVEAADAVAEAVAGDTKPSDAPIPLPVSTETTEDVATLIKEMPERIITGVAEVINQVVPTPIADAGTAVEEAITSDTTPTVKPWTHWGSK